MQFDKIVKSAVFETFVAGFLLVAGLWFPNRELLKTVFPWLEALLDVKQTPIQTQLVVLAIAALVAGTFIGQLVDALISPMTRGFKDLPVSPLSTLMLTAKTHPLRFGFAIFVKIFSWFPMGDPRARAMHAYLSSPRAEWFKDLLRNWAGASAQELEDERAGSLVQQHIAVRLRLHSETTRTLVDDAFRDVLFPGSLFVAFTLLFVSRLFAMFLDLCIYRGPVIFDQGLFWKLSGVYACAVVSSWFFKRRLRGFFGKVVTIGIHAHNIESQSILARNGGIRNFRLEGTSLAMRASDPAETDE